jgi:hypothetical protein
MQALLSRRAAFRRHGRHRDLAISATAAAAPLVNWVKSSGGSVNEAVEVQFLGGGQGFGLTCQTDVAQGTKLIQLVSAANAALPDTLLFLLDLTCIALPIACLSAAPELSIDL